MKARGLAAGFAILLGALGCGGSKGHFLYVVGPGTNSVLGFQEMSGGSLTALSSAFSTDSEPVSMVVHSSGNFAFVANFSAGNVSVFDRDHAKGTLTAARDPNTTNAIGPITVGTKPIALGINPNGQFLFVLNQGTSTAAPSISAFTVDGTSGNLIGVSGSPFATPNPGPATAPTSIAVAANSKFLYVADPAAGIVSGFAITTSGPTAGALSAIAGSPFKVGTAPSFLVVDPQARFLYVADATTNQIFAFTVDANTGVPSPVSGSPFAAGTKPVSLAIDATGVLLVAANQGSNNISAYSISGSTGSLSAISGSPFATGTGPVSVTVDSTNTFVYVGDSVSNDVVGFAISNGTLKSIAGSPFNIATSPIWLTSR